MFVDDEFSACGGQGNTPNGKVPQDVCSALLHQGAASPVTTTSPALIAVPSCVPGDSEYACRDLLASKGFNAVLDATCDRTVNGIVGEYSGISPEPGSMVPVGSTLTVFCPSR